MIFFSEMLSTLRKRDGYSQQELADKLKVSRSAISMYECGEREPDFKTVEAIVNLFRVDVSELLFGKSPSCESCRICGHDGKPNQRK